MKTVKGSYGQHGGSCDPFPKNRFATMRKEGGQYWAT